MDQAGWVGVQQAWKLVINEQSYTFSKIKTHLESTEKWAAYAITQSKYLLSFTGNSFAGILHQNKKLIN